MSKNKRKSGTSWSGAHSVIAMMITGVGGLAGGSLVAAGLVSQVPAPFGNFLWLFLYIAVVVWAVKIMGRVDTPRGCLHAVVLGAGFTLSTLLVLWINGSWGATVHMPITANRPSSTMALDVATLTAIVAPIGVLIMLLGLWGYRAQSKK